MRKFPDSAAILLAEGVVQPEQLIDPGMIADVDLLRVHTPAYIDSIRTGNFNEITRQKLGLPWSMELARRSHCAVAGTLQAARAALVDGIACNLAGGTHHAFPDRGEGFCVFNDVAIAIRALQADEPYLHAMVVDLDAHQGNGTHFIFRGDPHVFTYSIHVGRNYPSKKEPGDLDVELPRWVSGEQYLQQLHATLPVAIGRFEPDIIFYIAGVDVHTDDRFGQMHLSSKQMQSRDRWTIDLCRDYSIPTVVLYGGGYNKTEGMTTELHCQTVRTAATRFTADSTPRVAGELARRSPR
jgi:acetoin utilization deacetylase AcuC-like enzyme